MVQIWILLWLWRDWAATPPCFCAVDLCAAEYTYRRKKLGISRSHTRIQSICQSHLHLDQLHTTITTCILMSPERDLILTWPWPGVVSGVPTLMLAFNFAVNLTLTLAAVFTHDDKKDDASRSMVALMVATMLIVSHTIQQA
jgi:hypothetical protein